MDFSSIFEEQTIQRRACLFSGKKPVEIVEKDNFILRELLRSLNENIFIEFIVSVPPNQLKLNLTNELLISCFLFLQFTDN